MRAPRFLVPNIPDSGTVSLPEPESHHAIKVLRMKLGQGIELFDGTGNVADGTIVELNRRDVMIDVSKKRFEPNDHFGRLTLAVALPKGDRQRGTIEKLTELGADRLIPLETTFGVAEVTDRNAGRLDRYAVEACKQSRRNRLMEISASMSMADFCHEIRELAKSDVRTWVLHPPDDSNDCDTIKDLSSQFLNKPLCGAVFAIGPEGGFSNDEIASMKQAGAYILSLGDRILRVETAVAVACALGSLWVGSSNQSAKEHSH
jgi:16S rRNA (uracil1498-N3)-methyltransferase